MAKNNNKNKLSDQLDSSFAAILSDSFNLYFFWLFFSIFLTTLLKNGLIHCSLV